MERKCEEFGLEFGRWPYAQGKFFNGWMRDGDKVVRDESSKYGYSPFEFNGLQFFETDGEVWVLLDDCYSGMFIGDARVHIEKGCVLPSGKSWVPEHFDAYHYPSEELIQRQESYLFKKVSMKDDGSNAPQPPNHYVLSGRLETAGLGGCSNVVIEQKTLSRFTSTPMVEVDSAIIDHIRLLN